MEQRARPAQMSVVPCLLLPCGGRHTPGGPRQGLERGAGPAAGGDPGPAPSLPHCQRLVGLSELICRKLSCFVLRIVLRSLDAAKAAC